MRVKCELCGGVFEKDSGHYKEAIKFHWKQYCSKQCQGKAKMSRIAAKCSNPFCDISFTRTPSEAKSSKLLFCSISCSTSYYNAIRQNHTLLRKCKRDGCNNFIHTTDLTINYCGGKCSRLFRQGLTSYTKDSVTAKIQLFVKENDRIPTRNELGFLNRLARRFFGTWNKAIEAAGYDPNPVMFAKHYFSKDSHKCDSMAEKIVDDWLYNNNIEHRVHVNYPWSNGMKCDFLVGDHWIEIFGLEGHLKRYDELKKEKLRLIKLHHIKLIKLNLRDIYIKKTFEEKLTKKLG
jgi:hypothetical protein